MPYAATLGIEMLAASKDEVHAAVEWEERLTTAAGILHGGVLMGLADTAGAYCAYLNLPKGSAATATIESKTNFFSAVRSGGSRHVRDRSIAAAGRSSSRPTSSPRASTSPASPRRRRCSDAQASPTARRPRPRDACGGETLTVTVTVTETTAPPAPRVPPRLPFPLPEDGTLPVEAFNTYTESVDYPWERSLSALTDAFVEAGAATSCSGRSSRPRATRRARRRRRRSRSASSTTRPIAALPAEAQPA